MRARIDQRPQRRNARLPIEARDHVAAGAGDDQRAVEQRRAIFRGHPRDAAAGRQSDEIGPERCGEAPARHLGCARDW